LREAADRAAALGFQIMRGGRHRTRARDPLRRRDRRPRRTAERTAPRRSHRPRPRQPGRTRPAAALAGGVGNALGDHPADRAPSLPSRHSIGTPSARGTAAGAAGARRRAMGGPRLRRSGRAPVAAPVAPADAAAGAVASDSWSSASGGPPPV
jgi:hypothetical protein